MRVTNFIATHFFNFHLMMLLDTKNFVLRYNKIVIYFKRPHWEKIVND